MEFSDSNSSLRVISQILSDSSKRPKKLTIQKCKSPIPDAFFTLDESLGFVDLETFTVEKCIFKEFPVELLNQMPTLKTLNLIGDEFAEFSNRTTQNSRVTVSVYLFEHSR